MGVILIKNHDREHKNLTYFTDTEGVIMGVINQNLYKVLVYNRKRHMKKFYLYYTFKNDEPLKGYIGMTKKPIENGYKGGGKLIKRALKKYGKENFTRMDIYELEDKDECHYWEGFYIKYYKTLESRGGFNISPKGGSGYSDCHFKRIHFKGINKLIKEKTILLGEERRKEIEDLYFKDILKKRVNFIKKYFLNNKGILGENVQEWDKMVEF